MEQAPLSPFQLFGLTSVNLAYGFMIANQGLLLAPIESERLFPGSASIGLGGFAVCCGLAMLVGPAAGHWSDHHKRLQGRRVPCVLKSAVVVVFLTSLFPMWSSWKLGGVFMSNFLLQQIAWSVLQPVQYALVPDFVPAAQRGVAGGLTAALMLVGALCGLLSVRVVGTHSIYTHYFIQMGITVACVILVLSVCATMEVEESSAAPVAQADVAERAGDYDWVSDLPASYKFNAERHPKFAKLLLSKIFYGASVIVKAYLLFFVQDTFKLDDLSREQQIVSNAAVAAETTAALAAGAGIYLLGQSSSGDSESNGVAKARQAAMFGALWMSLLWLGPPLVGYGMERSLEANPDDVEGAAQTWVPFMVAGTTVWGFGQGVYVAGDQALGYSLLPDRSEAARYLGLFGVVSAVGSVLGGSMAGALLYSFGELADVAVSATESEGGPGYGYPGYAAMFFFATGLSASCCVTLFFINSRADLRELPLFPDAPGESFAAPMSRR